PVLIKSVTDQRLITGHPFSIDVSFGGTAVTDPDGDPLKYQVRVTSGPRNVELTRGLSISGTSIAGTPTEVGRWEIEVQADDNRGGNSVFYRFYLQVVANSAPSLVSANTPQLVGVGAAIDYDAAKSGAAFKDPDGDAITYAMEFRGNPQGLTISGTHVSGKL